MDDPEDTTAAEADKHQYGFARNTGDWIRGKLWSARRNRLRAALQAFAAERGAQSESTPAAAAIDKQIARLQRLAVRALETNALHVGWGNLQAARRLEILTLEPPALFARVEAVAAEAEKKLHSWRREAARTLLRRPSAEQQLSVGLRTAVDQVRDAITPSPPPDEAAPSSDEGGDASDASSKGDPETALSLADLRARAWLVACLVDGVADNTYFKQDMVVGRATLLLVLLLILLLTALATLTPAATYLGIPGSVFDGSEDLNLLPVVALFGAIGACFSGLRSVTGASDGDIPSVVMSSWFTLIRPAIGAVAAVIVFLAEAGGILDVVATDGFVGMLVLAFIAGFSDSLVVRVIGSVDRNDA